MPKSGIARAYGNFIFSFLRNLHVFHCDCTNLHSHQQSRRVHILLLSLQHLLFINFLMMAILTNVKWYHNIVLFAFLWQLGIMSIFSCTYCPSVSLLWRNVYLGLLPIFWFGWLGCLADIKSHELFVNIVNLPLVGHIISKDFLPICGLSFHLFPLLCKSFWV